MPRTSIERMRSAATLTAAAAAATLTVAALLRLRASRKRRRRPRAPAAPPSCRRRGADEDEANEHLREHTKIFERRIVRVADDVLCATGYGIANSICVRGETGLVVIDTCESTDVAEECLRDFRKVEGFERLPVAGIVYTHFHHDHVGGTDAFLRDARKSKSSSSSSSPAEEECGVEIWAHLSTSVLMRQFSAVMGPLAYVRSSRQFGSHLTRPDLENSGIGPFLRLPGPGSLSLVLPNRTYGRPLDDCDDEDGGGGGRNEEGGGGGGARRWIRLGGVDLTLIHAPGETDDQTVVYMPSRRTLFAADNYYEAFPNLYAIRGVPYRDPMRWVRSLDLMRSLDAEVMVPSHTPPVRGREEVARRLRNYRDAVAFVHDQTVRRALRGEHPDAIAGEVKLPAALRGLEYLKEFYGTVHWSCKSVFDGYLGWFSGEPSELFRLSPSDRAGRVVALGGGADRCLYVAEGAARSGDLRWALELATAVVRAPNVSGAVRRRATGLRVDVLRRLGRGHVCANARNYYLTTALEAEGSLDNRLPRHLYEEGVLSRPVEDLFDAMRYRIDADAAEGRNVTLRINLTDSGRSFLLVLRNSVLTVLPASEEACATADEADGEASEDSAVSIEVSCTELAWKNFVLSPVKTLLSGNLTFTKGSLADFRAFTSCFDRAAI